MKIHFLPDEVTIEAEPGEPLLDVAKRAGVVIPTGCLMGSCHACEVEIDEENIENFRHLAGKKYYQVVSWYNYCSFIAGFKGRFFLYPFIFFNQAVKRLQYQDHKLLL